MPLKHVVFTSQIEAEKQAGRPDWAVISITEPGAPANLKQGWQDILRLEFHDIDVPIEPYVLFTRHQARDIIEFVAHCLAGETEGILVHCRIGVSRSAAVALWISEEYSLPFPDKYILYNKHVYRTLREERHGTATS